ncbi:hypothetical protein CJ030_MR4G024735 [Morella rubra]|uniref:Uncharacterized protein n=1 Tax=Morella rubra TaxID=262757 RepID=A0A6A1WRX2_9ROSI|nr:hypothetical protein CJ030_MR4G024735 [Morella rubra]
MAGYEPPSFSLGLDLGLDSEPQNVPEEPPTRVPSPDPVPHGSGNGDEDCGPEVVDSDPEVGPEPPRLLKRLRRGPPSTKAASVRKLRESPQLSCAVDDEIEEFSSQDNDFLRAPFYNSKKVICSRVLGSKAGGKQGKANRFLTRQLLQAWEKSHNGLMFPKLTISPLRRFQLLDSDSDDSSSPENGSGEGRKVGQSSMEQQSNPDHSATLGKQKSKASTNLDQNDDLWKDFCPMKGFGIPTPALDEVCEEYFQSLKVKNVTKKMKSNVCVSNSMGGQENTISVQNDEARGSDESLPSAHRYFFHEDPRIQKLVRSRLAHFSPLGVTDKKGNQQPNSSVIDYMRQFSHEEASKQQATQQIKKSSTRRRNKSRKSNAEEVLHASGSWVDPKSNASTPKDAGKRRVQANGQSAGHWYTGPDGRKTEAVHTLTTLQVYVTGGGQELTGRSAYRQYRKESGAGFRKSKKKTSGKKRKR